MSAATITVCRELETAGVRLEVLQFSVQNGADWYEFRVRTETGRETLDASQAFYGSEEAALRVGLIAAGYAALARNGARSEADRACYRLLDRSAENTCHETAQARAARIARDCEDCE